MGSKRFLVVQNLKLIVMIAYRFSKLWRKTKEGNGRKQKQSFILTISPDERQRKKIREINALLLQQIINDVFIKLFTSNATDSSIAS